MLYATCIIAYYIQPVLYSIFFADRLPRKEAAKTHEQRFSVSGLPQLDLSSLLAPLAFFCQIRFAYNVDLDAVVRPAAAGAAWELVIRTIDDDRSVSCRCAESFRYAVLIKATAMKKHQRQMLHFAKERGDWTREHIVAQTQNFEVR